MTSPASKYVHGSEASEQRRLVLMNRLINEPSLRELKLRPGERVLDVGCGLGLFTRDMARVVGPGGAVVGIERDADQLAEARRHADAAGEIDLADFREGDAMALPLSYDEWPGFDVVYSRFVLEHLRDPLAAVVQMVRAARPGGRIALQDDDHELLRLWPPCEPLSALWRTYYKAYGTLGNDPLVGRKLVSLLHDAGAGPVRCHWIFYGGCAGDPDFPHIVENLVKVLESAKELILRESTVDGQAFTDAVHAFQAWSLRPDAACWYCMCFAEGIRNS